MKDFVNKHPRLYWCVVVFLAVLAFTIITCIGFGKLEKAEAAQTVSSLIGKELVSVNVPDISEWDISSWLESDEAKLYFAPQLLKDNLQDFYEYFVVLYVGDELRYYFGKSPFLISCTSTYTNYEYRPFGSFTFSRENDIRVNVRIENGVAVVTSVVGCAELDEHSGTYSQTFYNGSESWLVGSNYDIFENFESNTYSEQLKELVSCNNLRFPVGHKGACYNSTVPYVIYDSFTNDNQTLENYKNDFEESEIILNYHFSDKEFRSENVCVLESEFSVWLPSPAYVKEFGKKYAVSFANPLASDKKVTEEMSQDILAWQKKVGTDDTSVLYKMKRTLELEANYDFSSNMRYRFDYRDIHDILEYQYGDGETDLDFMSYYGFSDDEKVWLETMRNCVFGHMYISRVDTVLYEKASEADYYNGVSIYVMLLSGVGVFSRVDAGIIGGDAEGFIQNSVNQSLLDKIGQLDQNVSDLQGQLNNINGTLGSYDIEFDGNTLWGAIRSVGSGLIGLTSFLSAFAGVVGGFFSFLPYDMQEILGYIVIVSLFVVVWRLFKK